VHYGVIGTRSGEKNTVYVYYRGCAIYYNSSYPCLAFEINKDTGEIENLHFAMLIEDLSVKPEKVQELQKILEAVNNN